MGFEHVHVASFIESGLLSNDQLSHLMTEQVDLDTSDSGVTISQNHASQKKLLWLHNSTRSDLPLQMSSKIKVKRVTKFWLVKNPLFPALERQIW